MTPSERLLVERCCEIAKTVAAEFLTTQTKSGAVVPGRDRVLANAVAKAVAERIRNEML